MKKIFLLTLFFFTYIFNFSQNSDSIYYSLRTVNSDSVKTVIVLTNIVEPLKAKGDYHQAEEELIKAKQFIKGNDNIYFKLKIAKVQLLIDQEKYDEAIDSLSEVYNQTIKKKNHYYETMALRTKALIQMYMGDLDKSSKYFFEALEKCKKINSPPLTALIYGDIAAICYYNEQYKQATEYWEKSIEIQKNDDKKNSVANNLSNLGIAYIEINDLKKAEEKLKEALKIALEINDRAIEASVYTNLTKLEYTRKNYSKAIEYSNYAAKYYESVGKFDRLSNIYSNNAELARTNKQYKEALSYINKAFDALSKTENKINLSTLYLNKSAIYYDLNDYKSSHDYLQYYINSKDSIVNLENQKNINTLEKKYQLNERKKENELLNEQVKSQNIATSRMRIIIVCISVILIISIVFAFFIVKQNRIKSQINSQLQEKNLIINQQKEVVEEQHQQITDSIKYAERIQGAILPPRNLWQKILPSSYVLYMPKDVLSGDFYWIEETKDYIYVAAADCTGHGVPGALISIVNFNLLNKAVLEKNLVTPSEILDAVNLWLTDSLHQTYRESTVKDGMDVSLIAIHKHSNEVLFAGANNPIYIVSKGELRQIKGDKFPVGAFVEEKIQKFTTKSFKANKGDMIYLFSDGFADQFGGDNGKKYKYAPFQQKLIDISEYSLSDQRAVMKEEFLKWKGKHEQVDDVLLIGIKIA